MLQSQIVEIFKELFPPKEFPPPHTLSPGTIHITSSTISVSVYLLIYVHAHVADTF